MRTRTLLFLVFGLILAGVSLRSLWTFRAFNALLSTYGALVSRDERTELALTDVANISVDLEVGVRGWLTRTPGFLKPYPLQAPRLAEAFKELADLERDVAEGLGLVQRLRLKLDAWNHDIAAPLQGSDAERLASADLLALNIEGKRRMDAVRDDLAQLRALLQHRRQVHRRTIADFRGQIVEDWWSLGFALGFALAALGLILTRQIERPLAELAAYTEQTSGAELGPIVLRRGVREVQVLARALSSMAARLFEERLREQRFTELVTTLSAGGSVAAIADIALRSLAADQGATAGVLWVQREAGAPLTVAASLFVDRDRLTVGGSPLAREVFETGRLVQVEEATASAVHVLASALIDVVPRNLLVAPIRAEGRSVGAIELVGAHPFRAEDLAPSLTRVGLALQSAFGAETAATLQGRVVAVNEELSSQNEELHVHEEQLRVQSTELSAQRGELERRNEVLAAASRLKSEFLSSMSHELRTPLNAVIGFSDLLSQGAYGAMTAEQGSAVADIEAAGRQLLALVNDILDLSKIEAGRLEVRTGTMDVGVVVAQALSMIAPLAERKRLAVEGSAATTRRLCTGDETRVRQVLVNLLSNAVKFTPQGGSITVLAVESPDGVRIEVTDTGIGIRALDLARLFEPFTQLGARQVEGTGLGLSISKRLVELMGGAMGLVTEPGKGSTFSFSLPPPSLTAEVPVVPGTGLALRGPAAPAPVGASLVVREGASRSPTPTPTPSHSSSPARHGPASVLVVEDDLSAARATESVLEQEGYRVKIAGTAEVALAAMKDTDFDLIIIDLGLPGISGFQLIEEIRGGRHQREVPIAVLTARALTEKEERDLGTRVQLVARKGVMTGAGLLDRVADLCGMRRRKRHVLLIDDNEMNRRVVSSLLAPAGYDVTQASGGREGIDLAFGQGPDVILMDIRMPTMDGLEATEILGADARTSAIPIIALSAQAMPGDREAALRAGCVAYVTKPVARHDLLDALANAVDGDLRR